MTDIETKEETAVSNGLSDEQREEIISRLSSEYTDQITKRQKEITENVIEELRTHRNQLLKQKGYSQNLSKERKAAIKNSVSKEMKRYYAQKYDRSAGGDNYCVAIQMYGWQHANKQIGQELCQQIGLEQTQPDLCYLKNRPPVEVCRADTTKIKASCYNFETYMPEYTEVKGKTIIDYVNKDGTVKKGPDGKPLLKDGDFVLAVYGAANNTSTGMHCMRINVDENGKATVSAGNGDHVGANILKACANSQWNPRLGYKPVKIVHTTDYIEKACRKNLESLNDEQLMALAQEYNVSNENAPDFLQQTFDQKSQPNEAKEIMKQDRQSFESCLQLFVKMPTKDEIKLEQIRFSQNTTDLHQTLTQNSQQQDHADDVKNAMKQDRQDCMKSMQTLDQTSKQTEAASQRHTESMLNYMSAQQAGR